jgi:hypothetical protein
VEEWWVWRCSWCERCAGGRAKFLGRLLTDVHAHHLLTAAAASDFCNASAVLANVSGLSRRTYARSTCAYEPIEFRHQLIGENALTCDTIANVPYFACVGADNVYFRLRHCSTWARAALSLHSLPPTVFLIDNSIKSVLGRLGDLLYGNVKAAVKIATCLGNVPTNAVTDGLILFKANKSFIVR